ncbi:histone-arginine methyltransferase METTL23-like isoform X1 [Physella acuta]|uniref:histone-arginine methyltransferase METTL23-like isoform X1 n=1 Tax=Physella acuta TaxID=109671 RepID=UPI0027DB1544|nr:histone-arginine methyltransferase METTL23-like isoform X1 [Physella acuta]
MTNTFKSFTFHGSCEEDFISVKIPEFADAAYGLYIWPCAPVLSQFIWLNRERIKGKSVLEIGAGTALPGIVAAKCGANVILSDSNSYPQCLDICRESAQLNDVPNVAVVGITWGEVTSVLTDLPNIDVILSSDCFYDSKDFEDVIMTLSYLLHKTPTAEVWCTYQERSSDRSIEYLLDKWQLMGEEVDTPDMDSLETSFQGHTKHTIHLFIIRKKQDLQPLVL